MAHHLTVGTTYLLEVPLISWYKEKWMDAVWIMLSIVWGFFNGSWFFALYLLFAEFLKYWPINSLEVIFAGDTSAPSPRGMDPISP